MIFGLSNEQYALYRKAEMEVSDEHPFKCVCGRLSTGLHERNCAAFRKAVERRFRKLEKKNMTEEAR